MTFTFPNRTLPTSLINAAVYIHSYCHKHTKREDTFSTLSLKPRSLKFIAVEKYQMATLPHSRTPSKKWHFLNENEDPGMLLRKVKHQQADFSSRWPRNAEVGIIFSCQHGVSPSQRSEELTGMGQPQEEQRSGEPRHPAKSPLLFQLNSKAVLCCSLICIYQRGQRAASCCHHQTGTTAENLRGESPTCSLPWCSQCPKHTGEQEYVPSHSAQRGLRSSPVSAASSSGCSSRADPAW